MSDDFAIENGRFTRRFRYMPGADLVVESRPVGPSELPDLEYRYWQGHPRTSFLQRTPPNGRLLDMGCGSGGLAYSREYYVPKRTDIRMLGADLEPGEHHDQYDELMLGDFNTTPMPFEHESVDAVLASHFFEHIEDVDKYFRECRAVLKPGAQMYIEIPAPHTTALPHVQVLQDQGLPAYASSFYEDYTHFRTYSLKQMAAFADEYDFDLIGQGYVTAPHVDNELLYLGYVTKIPHVCLYGLWSKTRWAQYVIMQKPQPLTSKLKAAPYLTRDQATAIWMEPETLNGLYLPSARQQD